MPRTPKLSRAERVGRYIAHRMAGHRPLTKRQMLRKWKSLGSIAAINEGIDWIERNTTLSQNPMLFLWTGGEPRWGYRQDFTEVALNLGWNLRYMRTRFDTLQRVLDHAINSPVVTMTPVERKAAKATAAQAGGTVAFIDSMIATLSRI